MWHKPTKEMGRCFVKGILYPPNVRNVVTTIERGVVITKG